MGRWSRRRLLRHGATILALAVGGPALTACGFRPLYGARAGGTAAADLAAVEIGVVSDRLGQLLRNGLIAGMSPLGEPADPRFRLNLTLSQSSTALAIQQDTTITRYDQRIDVSFVLVELATGLASFRGRSLAIGGYDAVSSDFATFTAQQDSAKRTVREVAEDIWAQLAAYFAGRQAGG